MKNIFTIITLLFLGQSVYAQTEVIKLEIVNNYLVLTDTVTNYSYTRDIPKSLVSFNISSKATVDSMRLQLYQNMNGDVFFPKPNHVTKYWDFSDQSLVDTNGTPFTRSSLIAFFRQNTGFSLAGITTALPTEAENLTVNSVNSQQNDLQWTNPNNSTVQFEIQRSIAGKDNFYVIDTTENNATSYGDYVLLQGVNYDYRIRAIADNNVSNFTSASNSLPFQDVVFTGLVNTTANGNDLTKISGGTAWNAGAYGTEKISTNAYGELKWKVDGLGEGKIVALSNVNSNISFVDDPFAQSLGSNQNIQIFNTGSSAGISPDIVLDDGDYFKILRDTDGTIKYGHSRDDIIWSYYYTEPSKNTNEFFTSWLIVNNSASLDECQIINEVNTSVTTEPTNEFPSTIQDSLFHYQTTNQLDALRGNIIDWLTSGNGLSTDLISLVTSDIPNDAFNNPNRTSFSNLDRIDKYSSTLSSTTTFVNYVYHYVPVTKNNKSVLVMHGHSDVWGLNGIDFVLLDLVQAGYDVFMMYAPGNAENTPDQGSGTLHNGYPSLESNNLNPMYAFVKQNIDVINWIEANLSSNTFIGMCGVSQGGWNTVFTAAIEKRIEKSFDFSGSAPLYLRDLDSPSSGDYEQGHNSVSNLITHFYQDIASYFDLYSLASQGSEHRQIINTNDICCFRGIGYDGYESVITDRVNIFGGFYDYISEAGPSQHTVSSASRTILLNTFAN